MFNYFQIICGLGHLVTVSKFLFDCESLELPRKLGRSHMGVSQFLLIRTLPLKKRNLRAQMWMDAVAEPVSFPFVPPGTGPSS